MQFQNIKHKNISLSLSVSFPSYLEHISSPATSTSAPFHLGFVHHHAALFQADPVQLEVGLQGRREMSVHQRIAFMDVTV